MLPSTMMRRATAGSAVLALTFALSACGADGGEDPVEPAADETTADAGGAGDDSMEDAGDDAAQAESVAVSAFEFGYDLETPTEAGTYTFDLVNDGTMQHDLVIEGGDASGSTAIIGAGEADSFTVTLEPGEYTLYCSVGSHRSQGMEVTFTVS